MIRSSKGPHDHAAAFTPRCEGGAVLHDPVLHAAAVLHDPVLHAAVLHARPPPSRPAARQHVPEIVFSLPQLELRTAFAQFPFHSWNFVGLRQLF